jgi:hypothetical protein
VSDFPNGRPPGQNNLDASVESYVPKENDPSAGAHKPDEDRQEEDGIEPVEPEPKQEVRTQSKPEHVEPKHTGPVTHKK